jgi:hypothetical protein
MAANCAKETAGVDVALTSSCQRFWIKMPATALPSSRNPFAKARRRLKSGVGKLVEQMLRQRCDTGRQSLLFVT